MKKKPAQAAATPSLDAAEEEDRLLEALGDQVPRLRRRILRLHRRLTLCMTRERQRSAAAGDTPRKRP